MSLITRDDVCSYSGIDYADDMVNRNVDRAIKSADAYLKGSIGEDYPTEDPRARELLLMLADDFYHNRGLIVSGSSNNMARKLFNDMSLQLRLEIGGGGCG